MKTIFNKVFNRIFNRLVITVALILVQLGYFAVLLLRLTAYAGWLALLYILAAALISLFIIWRDDNPAYKMGWTLLVCLLPILGATMYVFFGNKRPSKSLKRKIEPQEQLHLEDLQQIDDLQGLSGTRMLNTVNYIANNAPYPAWTGSRARYYALGDLAYPDLLEDLRKAEQFIFMEFFIISEGKMWDGIFEILREKAAAGVEVRIIYDDVGSINTLSWREVAKVREAGIKTMAFNPMRPVASLVYNNRDHRKLVVIDGNVGYSGGFNIADEYINKQVRFGHWKDSGIRVEGKAVWNYTVMFLNMWNAFRHEDQSYDAFRPDDGHPASAVRECIVQPYADSPLDDENTGENVYLEIISQSEDYVYIFTPYLIIDNEMQTALKLAAKRGVDVRIVTPGIPDKKMVYRLTRSYYGPLLRAGVRIFEYTPGFLHAKSFVSDDRIGVVGTINMDYRSLFLHFECGTLLIGGEAVMDLKGDCRETFAVSKEVHLEDCRRGFFGLLFDSILRVVSPLM